MTAKILIKYAKALQDWIVQSEMGLTVFRNNDDEYDDEDLDKTDSFYPAYIQLGYIIEKLSEE